jgi:uncharacterized protein (DUF1684 family)
MATRPEDLDVPALLVEREATLRGFRDGRRSPYAAVARHELPVGGALVLGSSPEADLQLEGLQPRHARVRVEGDEFVLDALDAGATLAGGARSLRLKPGAKTDLGRFVLRLSHQNFPAVLVLDPESPRVQQGPPPRWFPPAPAFRVRARLERAASPKEELVASTQGNQRRALRLGTLRATVEGQSIALTALRFLEPGVDEAALSVHFRDATTGRESYPVGRYVEPEPIAGEPDAYVLDFNRAYNPTCAFSEHYNCPIPPRENVLALAVRAGERDPGGPTAA